MTTTSDARGMLSRPIEAGPPGEPTTGELVVEAYEEFGLDVSATPVADSRSVPGLPIIAKMRCSPKGAIL